MMKHFLTGLLIFLWLPSLIAQKDRTLNKGKKFPNIGFAYTLADTDPSVPKEDSVYGFSAMYWQGLSRKFDISFRFNGIFSNKINNSFFSPNKNRMSSEFELAIHAKAFKNFRTINPFLTIGTGIGNYKEGSWTRYEIGGAGLQFNFGNEFYLLVQAHYRYSLETDEFPHNAFYSFGLTRSLYAKKKHAKQKPDKDKDGVTDDLDACPDTAGVSYLQGCPDSDLDSIADRDDKCPEVRGLARYQGCPVPDSDNDGVNDEDDKCPKLAGPPRHDGCPVPDTDQDGVNDEEDKCPNRPGTKANQGCPPVSEEVKRKVNTAAKNILFITASFELESRSFPGLNEVVRIMKQNPNMELLVSGHTDSVGTVENNQRLSDNRANAVKNYIVSKGIAESRVKAVGFGETRPIADNGTPAGRRQNRRVELLMSYYQ